MRYTKFAFYRLSHIVHFQTYFYFYYKIGFVILNMALSIRSVINLCKLKHVSVNYNYSNPDN